VTTDCARDVLNSLWSALAGKSSPVPPVDFTDEPGLLPSVYDVTGFAAATVAAPIALAEPADFGNVGSDWGPQWLSWMVGPR
jgi:hypothetical protein